MRNLLALMLLGVSMISYAAEYKDEYPMSVVVGSKLPWGEGATYFADLVRERSAGRINIKVYTASALIAGKQTNEFLTLRQGSADFAFASTINWSATIRELNLFNLPFFFPDHAAVDRVINGETGRMLEQIIHNKGVTILAWGENGFRELTNSVRPITTPEDLKGLTVRVVGTPMFIDIMRVFGANPFNMNWLEAKEAFQKGTVDGQENPILSIILPTELWQYHEHITVWHYVIDPLMLTVSNDAWEDFTPADQILLREAAVEAAAWQKQQVRTGLVAPNLSAYQTLREKGMRLVILNAEQIAAFKKLTDSVYEKWVPRIGEALFAQAQAEIASSPAPSEATPVSD